jgi:hypothetical protein
MSAIDAIVKIIGLDDYHLASRPAVFVCCFVSSVGTWFYQFIMNNLCRFGEWYAICLLMPLLFMLHILSDDMAWH